MWIFQPRSLRHIYSWDGAILQDQGHPGRTSSVIFLELKEWMVVSQTRGEAGLILRARLSIGHFLSVGSGFPSVA